MLGSKKFSLADVERGLGELVEVYTLKYRETLRDREDLIQNEINNIQHELTRLNDNVIATLDVGQYAHTSATLGIRSRVVDSHIEWDEFEPVVIVTLMLEDLDDISGSMRQLGKNKRVPLLTDSYRSYAKLQDELNVWQLQLDDVTELYHNINEKTHEIRTKLVEIRLRKTELADLMNHPEVLELLQ